MTPISYREHGTVNWRQVLAFLGLTFGLTYLLDLLLYLLGGYGANAATSVLLQVQMLIPATVAISLQLFVFRDSPIYRLRELPRWFFYFYLGFAVLFVLVAASLLTISNTTYQIVVNLAIQLLLFVGLLLVVGLRLGSGKEAFRRAGLGGGRLWHWVALGLLIVVTLAVTTGLDALFGLGQAVDVKEVLGQAAGETSAALEAIPDLALLLLVGAQSLIVGPLLGLLIAFGEEYGWRGYLQKELVKLGQVRGILLVGLIWGLWHAPVVAMGHNYPGHPILGMVLMTIMTVAWAFILGYAMLKSGSVWLAAFLHALLNQTASFLMVMVYRPTDTVFSFGNGLYGVVVWAAAAALLVIADRKAWIRSRQPDPAEEAESAQLEAT
jgi:membrane protease YdiL (CAAX protease family)